MMGFIIFLISMSMMLIAFVTSKKNLLNQEKNSQFECGFNPMSGMRNSFSLQFFLITIIFLIFDVEIALLLPSMISMTEANSLKWSIIMFIFISILILGYLLWMMWYILSMEMQTMV
uniref:NADH dehydrogenase subunit 3 n=1 Tax=Ichthyoxenos japonensis TaxID=2033261 RepID=UPI000EF2D832|nr:NADH dehydrogenase subunit 3 [Ichthyoxenos japonensis]ATO58525.1 NADH dehydrogenase subunit 3 [Ichthyoxenos japonensis]